MSDKLPQGWSRPTLDAIEGAFRHFKNTAHQLGLLQSWHEFRDAAMKQFTLDWAEANGVQVTDDVFKRPGR